MTSKEILVFCLWATAVFVLVVNLAQIVLKSPRLVDSGEEINGGPLYEDGGGYIPRLDFVEAYSEGESTWFGVKTADSPGTNLYTPLATGSWYAIVEPLFIVETQLEGRKGTVKLLRSSTVIVQLHSGIVTGTKPVPYLKKDLWKIWATVMKGQPERYEFVQEGWLEFDPARDMR